MTLFTVIYEFTVSKQSFYGIIYSYLHFNGHLTVVLWPYLQLFTNLLSFNSRFMTLFTVIYEFTVI